MAEVDVAPVDVPALEEALAVPAEVCRFSEAEILGLPGPVQRYFRAAIAFGTPLARAARLDLRGHIRLRRRWLPWRAREVLAPQFGFVWPASVLGVLRGADRYLAGQGAMDWRLLGRWPVASAEGVDVGRSAAGRVAAEGMLAPTALLPRFGVSWDAVDDDHLVAEYAVDDVEVELHLHVALDGRVLRFHFGRWGDPDGSGTFRPVPFGGDVLAWATFDGVTIPSQGRVGWWYGSPRFHEGEFFRYEVTDLRLVR